MPSTRRQEIIDAFVKIGMRKGLDNTTMQDIAKEVGISVGTIYLDFKNKEALIDAFEKRTFSELDGYVDQVLKQSAPAAELLHSLLVDNVEFVSKHIRQNQSVFDFFHNDVVKHIKKSNKDKRQQFEEQRIQLIEKVLEQGVQEGSFEITDTKETAKLLFIAFSSPHLAGPFLLERQHEMVVKDAEGLFQLLLRSITKR